MKNSQLAAILQQIRRGSFSDYANSLFSKEILEPRARVELATCRLRIGCSTTELPRRDLFTITLAIRFRNYGGVFRFVLANAKISSIVPWRTSRAPQGSIRRIRSISRNLRRSLFHCG